ncbi:hypothetical protein [Tenacibaculum sp. 47A_GOM-205m]|uniref:hypothetical protein n=1 Tax=Tenacibaculum sp. 47A_GOM-205m TaxID=1380384 RepID=UPI00048F4DD5|nr:hypothetical protein [Tenacibaculum sp. 47A_GOM-205m]
MKKTTFYILPVLFLLIISCSKTVKEQALTIKDVFPTQKNTDSTIVFDLDTVKSFNSLTAVFCKNYDNKKIKYFIKTKKNEVPFSIRSIIACGHAVCGLIKFKNVLFIDYYTDSIFFHNRIKYNFNTVDVEKMLKRQFFNKGNDPEFSDTPYTNLIYLEFLSDLNNFKPSLKNKLDTISKSYYKFIVGFNRENIDSLKKLYPLKIKLNQAIPLVDENGYDIKYNPAGPIEIVE